MAGDYPQDSMYLLQHLFNNWYRDLSLDKMAAAAVVTGIAILVLILLLQKAWEEGEQHYDEKISDGAGFLYGSGGSVSGIVSYLRIHLWADTEQSAASYAGSWKYGRALPPGS